MDNNPINTLQPNNKKYIIMAVLAIALILALIGFQVLSSRQGKGNKGTETESVLPANEVIPTIDASVKVDLTSAAQKEVTLSISRIPNGTTNIEYTLSYKDKSGLEKGAIGSLMVDGESKTEKDITLGTCSSGTCVYDYGEGLIKVDLKFNGDYGSKIFEGEFKI